jgi:hypothetical protein
LLPQTPESPSFSSKTLCPNRAEAKKVKAKNAEAHCPRLDNTQELIDLRDNRLYFSFTQSGQNVLVRFSISLLGLFLRLFVGILRRWVFLDDLLDLSLVRSLVFLE